jgi:hypothetical protein
MQPFYVLSSFKLSTTINCVGSKEKIQQAYDVNGDAKQDIYTCDHVIFGNKNIFGQNITFNTESDTIINNNQLRNFTTQDGLSFTPLNYGAGGAFFIDDIDNNKIGEVAFGLSRYGHLDRGLGVILKNNLPNGKYTINTIFNQTEQLITIDGGRINDNTNNVGYYVLGDKMASLGDVNNDDYKDFLISSSNNLNTVICIIYGNTTYSPKTITAAYLTKEQGFTINFHYPYHHTPKTVDLTGDGYPDIIVAATRYYYSGVPEYGKVDLGQFEVFYGKQNNSFIDSFNMSASVGHKFNTPNITETQNANKEYPYFIDTIKAASGFGKIILGSPAANANTGMVRIITGRSDLSQINLVNSANDPLITHIYGENKGDEFGSLVANIGDIDNDGLADIAICAAGAYSNLGACYILYGKETWPKDFYVTDMTSDDGFIIKNPDSKTNLAGKIVPLGDFNGDNADDFAISTKDGKTTHIIYGKNGKYNEAEITATFSASSTVSSAASISKSNTITASKSGSVSAALPNTQTLQLVETNSRSESISVSISGTSDSVSASNTKTKKLPATTATAAATKTFMDPVAQESENIFPTAVSGAMSTANEYGAVARMVNPNSVSQGARTDAIRKLTTNCDASSEDRYDFDVFSNPLGFAFEANNIFANFNNLKQAAQVAIGNDAILTGAAIIHYALHKYIPQKSHFPGALVIPVLALITPSMKAGALILSEANEFSKFVGVMSFLPIAATAMTFAKFKNNFDNNNPVFSNNYGLIYNGYNEANKFFLPLDLAMNAAIGFASGIKFSTDNSCDNSIYVNTAIYVAYFSAIIIYRPYNSKFENAFAMTVAASQTIPLLIASLQKNSESAKDNSFLNMIKETLPTVTDIIILLKTVFDVGYLVKDNCFTKKIDTPEISAPLLNVPQQSSADNTPTKSISPTDSSSGSTPEQTTPHAVIQINNPLNPAHFAVNMQNLPGENHHHINDHS